MIQPTYCSPKIDPAYLQLLCLARLSSSNDILTADESAAIITTLEKIDNSPNSNIKNLLPLILKKLAPVKLANQLPTSVLDKLKLETLRIVAGDMANQHMLSEALKLLSDNEIPVLLLKGAAFANNLYPADSPRIGVDFDILIGRQNFTAACKLLANHMVPAKNNIDQTKSYSANFESAFYSKNHRMAFIELHKQIKNPYIFNISEQELWGNSHEHPSYASSKIRVLSAEHTLLHLAIHAFRDLDFCNHNILDAHEVFCQWHPSSEDILKAANKWQCKYVLFMLLSNCKDVMNTPVPKDLLESLKPGQFTGNINKHISQADQLLSHSHNNIGYRIMQLASQIFFPDSKLRGAFFQLHYIKTQLRSVLQF